MKKYNEYYNTNNKRYVILSSICRAYAIGGFREREILNNIVDSKIVQDDNNYLIVEFTGKNNNYFWYDFLSNRIVN